MIIILLILLILSFVILTWQVSNIISVISGSLYVKADRNIIKQTLKLACLKKVEIFYDLGSGNGDALIEAAKFKAKVIGFEISPYYYFLSYFRTYKYPNIKIKYQNINNVNLEKADVVYCYLLPEFLEKLSGKFQKELKPGARLISIGFPIRYKTSLLHARACKREVYVIQKHKVYIYKF